MRHASSFAAALCAAVMTMAACDTKSDRTRPISPTGPVLEPPPLPPPPQLASYIVLDAPAMPMTIGETVTDRIRDNDAACTIIDNRWLVPCRHFLVTAPTAGTLAATLTWDPIKWDMLLLIRMGDRDFTSPGAPWSPLVARMNVNRGQEIRVMVGLAGWGDVHLDAPFTLTTRIE